MLYPRIRGLSFKRNCAVLSISLAVALSAACSRNVEPEEFISFEMVNAHIKYLSSDALAGRGSLSPDVRLTEEYVARQFREAGLREFPEFPGYRHEFSYVYKGQRRPDIQGQEFRLANIVGYLQGEDPDLQEEFIVFGAHHDHIGTRGEAEDNIYNGAEDNATGTTAVLALAAYFAKLGTNRRSLMFVTFAAEEIGMVGSRQLVKELPIPVSQIKAVINFEMIGKPSDSGDAECYLTGWERSDLGGTMQDSLGDFPLVLQPGPEVTKRLFFASDNISFARAGVVSHTLAGIQSTNDPLAHSPDDEYETLDIQILTRIIQGVARASRTLISGDATPTLLETVE